MSQRLFKIRGRTLDEAYAAMRRRHGPDAIVLSTQQVTEGGVFGLFAQKSVEITVSAPAPAAGRPASPVERRYAAQSRLGQDAGSGETVQYFERLVREAQHRMRSGGGEARDGAAVRAAESPVVPFPKRANAPGGMGTPELQRDLHEIREMIQVLYSELPGAGLPAEFAPHYRTLIERGVSRKVAAALIGAVVKHSDLGVLRDGRVFAERLHMEIRKVTAVTGGISYRAGECRRVALCGPTGVGKTTNLAKIAAHFAVRERARVGLVTADTYRIAAPEQLKVYANIIGVPLRVASNAKDAAAACAEFRDFDVVLIDTAGGSQFNLDHLHELKATLHAVRPHETILVGSAGARIEDLRTIVSNFKCVEPASLMFTKLDETRQYGALFSLLVESGLPLGYVSTGQQVPDDLRVATAGMVADLVVEGGLNRGGSSTTTA